MNPLKTLSLALYARLTRSTLPRRLLSLLPFVALGLLLLGAHDALARVGGGESFGGGHSSSSSSSYGGGGSDDGGLLWFLIWLAIRHPYIGIPLLILGVVFKLVTMNRSPKGAQRSGAAQGAARASSLPPLQAPRRDFSERIREVDANFSEPAFLDFAQALFAKVHQERTGAGLDALSAWLTDSAKQQLRMRSAGVKEVRNVVFGATRISDFQRSGSLMTVEVHFEVNLSETRAEKPAQILLTERWRLRKSATTLSPPPQALIALTCPSCGNPAETRPNGTCVHCDTPVGSGKVLWELQSIRIMDQRPIEPPPLQRGAQEVGTDLPTIFDPQLPANMRAFRTRHPEFDPGKFTAQVHQVFVSLQEAWSTGSWEKARAYETDHLFQTHRYWIERYAHFGLQNRLEQVEVLEIAPVRLRTDAFYESITLRIKAKMLDYTVDRQGAVVAGDRAKHRVFSEYWTFLRTAGSRVDKKTDSGRCPSCNAPLDKMSQTGVCGYCDAKISSGEHDWVLTSIEQDESYRG